MTKRKTPPKTETTLPEDGPFITDISRIRNGERVQFRIDDKTYYLNFPTDEDRDEYSLHRDVVEMALWQRDDIKNLMDTPLPPLRLQEIDADIERISHRMDEEGLDTDQLNYWKDRLAGLYKEREKSAAEFLVERNVRIQISRWMAKRLLADEQGNLIAATKEMWDLLPPIVQDEATARTALLMQSLHMIRFLSEQPQDSE